MARDLDVSEIARSGGGGDAGDVGHAVDVVGRLPFRAPLPAAVLLGGRFEQDACHSPDLGVEQRFDDAGLPAHELAAAVLRDDVVRLLASRERARPLLRGEGEGAEVVELLPAGVLEQVVEVRLRFAGEADEACRPQRQAGDAGAQSRGHAGDVLQGVGAMHGAQDVGVAVLDGDVEVAADVPARRDDIEQLVGDHRRIAVEQADPEVTLQRVQPPEQLGERRAVLEVAPVAGHVLGDDVELADAFGENRLGLGDHVVDRPRAELAADAGDGAERADVLAAFGDLEIGVRAAGEHHRGDLRGEEVRGEVGGDGDDRFSARVVERLRHDFGNAPQVVHADHGVHVRAGLEDAFAIPLREAAGNDDGLAAAVLLELAGAEDRGDRLLAGVLDERAGVDDDGVGLVDLDADVEAALVQLRGHDLEIDEILRAAQRDEADGDGRARSRGARW